MAPTYAQLEAESWWNREIVTPEVDWLGDELCRRTGRPRAAAGSKGDRHHLSGSHRSQEWIRRSAYCTNRSYTVQDGLSGEQERWIAGVDFVPGEWGSSTNRRLMREQTGRLVTAMKSGQLSGVREVIGTLDGRTVIGVRSDGATFRSDDSHLDHWHLTLDRRRCRDRELMERIVAVALGDTPKQPQEEDMPLSDADLERIAEATARRVLNKTLGSGSTTVGQVLQPLPSNIAALRRDLATLAGRDLVDEQQVAVELAPLVLAALGPQALADAIADRLRTAPTGGGPVSQETLVAALRQVLGSLDERPPAGLTP